MMCVCVCCNECAENPQHHMHVDSSELATAAQEAGCRLLCLCVCDSRERLCNMTDRLGL